MALLAALALSPCACNGNKVGVDIPASGPLSTWKWRAVRMTVSSLTTPFPAEAGVPARLDTRVAFFDTENDETKALGLLTIQVSTAGRQVARVEVPLTDERRHHQHWDPVTETYSVDIQLAGIAEPRAGQALEIRAVFEGEDGAVLHADRDVKWPGERPQ